MLNLVDFYGTSFIVFILTIGEIVGVCWIYGKYIIHTQIQSPISNIHCPFKCSICLGVNRLCRDIEFMINIRPGIYWRVCWALLTPLLMFTILIYTFVTYTPLSYKGQSYPDWANSKSPIKRSFDCISFNLKCLFFVFSFGMDSVMPWHSTVAILGGLCVFQKVSQ